MNTAKFNTHGSIATLVACVLASALPLSSWAAAEAAQDANAAKESAAATSASREETQQRLESAQKRLEAAAREVAELSMSMSDRFMPYPGVPTRAMLDVNIRASGRGDDDIKGVEILGVSPGGAAAAAGIKAGDVIVEFDGRPLAGFDGGSPSSKFLRAMREVDPGEKVTLNYLRDGKSASAIVTARASENRLFTMPALPPLPGQPPGPPDGPRFAFFRAMGVLGSAEFMPLTPKLGQYFGTDKGLLVVRAPTDTRLKLEEGDVILDIDGRVPTSPAHALRILGSYQPGESLKINALRMKKRIVLDLQLPERLAD